MLYGITGCYLPSGRGDIPALTPTEAGTRLSDPGGVQGRVDLVDLVSCREGIPARRSTVTRLGTDRARRALTSFMCQTTLTTRHAANQHSMIT